MIEPTFDPTTNTITIPKVVGATHYINDTKVKGRVVIQEDTVVIAKPNPGSHFRPDTVTEWLYEHNGNNTNETAVEEEKVEDAEAVEDPKEGDGGLTF